MRIVACQLPNLLLFALVDLSGVGDVRGEILHALPEGREQFLHVLHLALANLRVRLQDREAVPEFATIAGSFLTIGLEDAIMEA